MKERMKKLRKNHKGFSLVELIIVIAIMAILIGILAPQFIKYVNKSRTATDTQNAEMIQNAVSAVLADDTLTGTIPTSITAAKGTTITAGSATDNFYTLLQESIGTKWPDCKVTANKGYTITITGSSTAGYTCTVVTYQ